MTARYEFQADGTVKVRRYEWDDGARLTAVTDGAEVSPKVPTAGAVRTEWTYDVGGRRVREIIKTRTATATWTTDRDVRYVWDGTEIIQERDTASIAVLTDYYTAGEVQFSPSTLNSQPSTYYYTRDHLGSVRELIDATGTVRARYDYDPYGVRTKLSGDLDTPVGYTGHRYHESSGLHLALYRAYDGELGRWLSEDPMEQVTGESAESLPEGPNLYSYVGNGPLDREDPLGLHLYPASHYKPMNPNNPYPGLLGPKDIASCYADSYNKVMLAAGLAGGAAGAAESWAASGLTRADLIRTGPTVVSNQLVNGLGSTGATVVKTCIKGGGGKVPWHFHIHRYNWYKPWLWFKNTPIIKP